MLQQNLSTAVAVLAVAAYAIAVPGTAKHARSTLAAGLIPVQNYIELARLAPLLVPLQRQVSPFLPAAFFK
eukprot:3940481-Rhodomonas_salina.1